MELKVDKWYYNPPSQQYDEAWTYVNDMSKGDSEYALGYIDWDTYVMRDGMYLAVSNENIPIDIATEPGVKIRKATGKDLGLLISRIFNYGIEIDGEL